MAKQGLCFTGRGMLMSVGERRIAGQNLMGLIHFTGAVPFRGLVRSLYSFPIFSIGCAGFKPIYSKSDTPPTFPYNTTPPVYSMWDAARLSFKWRDDVIHYPGNFNPFEVELNFLLPEAGLYLGLSWQNEDATLEYVAKFEVLEVGSAVGTGPGGLPPLNAPVGIRLPPIRPPVRPVQPPLAVPVGIDIGPPRVPGGGVLVRGSLETPEEFQARINAEELARVEAAKRFVGVQIAGPFTSATDRARGTLSGGVDVSKGGSESGRGGGGASVETKQ